MKKLNKILVAISTVALTFCVWGTQTQAIVVTNEEDVPTHINAKTNKEFFGDLQQVLNHIKSRLVVEGKELDQIEKLFLKENKLTKTTANSIPFSEYVNKQYNYALTPIKIHIGIATGYLYNLLLKSTISTQLIQNVYRLMIKHSQARNGEIIFQLPHEKNVYYTPCSRWFLWPDWMKENQLTPTPMTVRESFEKGPEFVDPESYIYLNVKAPNSKPDEIITTFLYHKTDLLNHADTIISKLISTAGINIEDEKLGLAFKSHSNTITDYKKFVEEYNKKNK